VPGRSAATSVGPSTSTSPSGPVLELASLFTGPSPISPRRRAPLDGHGDALRWPPELVCLPDASCGHRQATRRRPAYYLGFMSRSLPQDNDRDFTSDAMVESRGAIPDRKARSTHSVRSNHPCQTLDPRSVRHISSIPKGGSACLIVVAPLVPAAYGGLTRGDNWGFVRGHW
jgi:hypothetical protein